MKGDAEAKRYAQIVAALGSQNATAIEVIDRVRGEIGKVKLPQFLIFGGGNGNAGLGEGIMAKLLQSMTPTANEPQEEPAASGASDPAKPPIKKTSAEAEADPIDVFNVASSN